MAYEQKDMTGSLWPNKKREKDTHPNVTGSVLIDGKTYYLSGWTKQTNDGVKWISLSVKAAEEKKPESKAAVKEFDGMEGDIPF